MEETHEDELMLRIRQHVQSAMDAHHAQARTAEPSAMPNIPFVTLTYAQSIDGSIAAVRGTPTLLSGAQSMRMTHMLRTMHDVILVGIGTILADNPSLNARFAEGERFALLYWLRSNPKPVIVDTSLRCPLSIKLFTSSACEKPIILYANTSTSSELQQRRRALEHAGATIVECRTTTDAHGVLHVDIRHGLELLFARGVQSVMVEGGAAILTACLRESARAHLVDSVVVTIAPTFIGGLRAVGSLVAAPETEAPTTAAARTSEPPSRVTGVVAPQAPAAVVAPSAFPRLQHPTFHPLGDDVVLVGRLLR